MHICLICRAVYRDARTLRRHWLSRHDPVEVTCPVCGKAQRNRAACALHMRNHECLVCEQPACAGTFTSVRNFARHAKNVHGDRECSCEACGRRLSTQAVYRLHAATCTRAARMGAKPGSPPQAT